MADQQNAPTRKQVFSLARANMLDQALQFIMPMVLTRFLDPEGFAQYRMFWLAAATVASFAPLALPQSLYYFLPRNTPERQRVVLSNTLASLFGTGLIGALLVNPWFPLLPQGAVPLSSFGVTLPLFVLVWVMASAMDDIANADLRVPTQARIMLILSILRLAAVAGAAAMTEDVRWVIGAFLGFAAFKLVLLIGYIVRFHGIPVRFELAALREQLTYAVPFAIAGALFSIIQMADQWIAALLFTPVMFAAFSVASVAGPVAMTISYSIGNAVLPQISQAHAAGDIPRMVELNRKANTAVSFLLHPLLVALFVFAEEVITIVYTGAYVAAADAMRVYLVGLLAYSYQVNPLLRMFAMGKTATIVNAGMFFVAIGASYVGATTLGITGAAIGGAAARFGGQLANMRAVAPHCGVRTVELIDWKSWWALLLSGTAGGVLAWWAAGLLPASLPRIAVVGAGGLVLVLGYFAALVMSGHRDLVTRHVALSRLRGAGK